MIYEKHNRAFFPYNIKAIICLSLPWFLLHHVLSGLPSCSSWLVSMKDLFPSVYVRFYSKARGSSFQSILWTWGQLPLADVIGFVAVVQIRKLSFTNKWIRTYVSARDWMIILEQFVPELCSWTSFAWYWYSFGLTLTTWWKWSSNQQSGCHSNEEVFWIGLTSVHFLWDVGVHNWQMLKHAIHLGINLKTSRSTPLNQKLISFLRIYNAHSVWC